MLISTKVINKAS